MLQPNVGHCNDNGKQNILIRIHLKMGELTVGKKAVNTWVGLPPLQEEKTRKMEVCGLGWALDLQCLLPYVFNGTGNAGGSWGKSSSKQQDRRGQSLREIAYKIQRSQAAVLVLRSRLAALHGEPQSASRLHNYILNLILLPTCPGSCSGITTQPQHREQKRGKM